MDRIATLLTGGSGGGSIGGSSEGSTTGGSGGGSGGGSDGSSSVRSISDECHECLGFCFGAMIRYFYLFNKKINTVDIKIYNQLHISTIHYINKVQNISSLRWVTIYNILTI